VSELALPLARQRQQLPSVGGIRARRPFEHGREQRGGALVLARRHGAPALGHEHGAAVGPFRSGRGSGQRREIGRRRRAGGRAGGRAAPHGAEGDAEPQAPEVLAGRDLVGKGSREAHLDHWRPGAVDLDRDRFDGNRQVARHLHRFASPLRVPRDGERRELDLDRRAAVVRSVAQIHDRQAEPDVDDVVGPVPIHAHALEHAPLHRLAARGTDEEPEGDEGYRCQR
jgi:hypothetical protein